MAWSCRRACVADHTVDAPVTVKRFGGQARDLVGVGDVGLHGQRAGELPLSPRFPGTDGACQAAAF